MSRPPGILGASGAAPGHPVLVWIDESDHVVDASGPLPLRLPDPNSDSEGPAASSDLTASRWRGLLSSARAGRQTHTEIRFERGREHRHARLVAHRCSDDRVVVAITDVTDLHARAERGEVFEKLANRSHLGIGILDSDQRVVWSNDAFARLLTISVPLAGRTDFMTLLAPRLEDRARSGVARALTGDRGLRGQQQLQLELEAGRVIRLLIDPLADSAGDPRGTLVVVDDATESADRDRKVRDLTSRLRIATAGAGLCVWDWDVQANILWWDDGMFELYGVQPDEFSSNYEAWRSRVHPDDLAEAETALQHCLENKSEFRSTFRVVFPDGKTKYIDAAAGVEVDESGAIRRIVGVNFDASERENSRNQRDRASDMLNAAGEIAGIGGWEYSCDGGTLTWTDRTYLMHGLDPSAPITIEAAIACYRDDEARREISAAVDAALTKGIAFEKRLPIRHRSGKELWLHSVGVPTFRGKDIIGVRGAVRDVTAEREQQLREESIRKAAEDANRAKGEFVANMSHEIRTPMTAILGFGEMLADPKLAESERSHAVTTIRRNGEHLLGLINDLLDLSKIDAGHLEVSCEEVDPTALVNAVVQTLQPRAATRDLELRAELGDGIPATIQSDPLRLRQILTNLAGNALKFTHEGAVRIVVDVVSDDTLELRVIDNGIGMSAETVERVFQPFVQADASIHRRYGGTGLGLSISRQLAHLLGGDLKIRSAIGRGTQAILTLPLSGAVPTGAAASGSMPNALDSRDRLDTDRLHGRRVLLAEDGTDNQQLFSAILRRAGIEVEVAGDGLLALEAIEKAEQPFDLILMDMAMPRLDGEAATREIRRRGLELPIIALTAHAMQGDREHFLEVGCSDFASKPIRRQALLETISRNLATSGPQPA